MVKAIVLIAIILLLVILVPFIRQLMMDKRDLRKAPIEVRFRTFMETINEGLLDGKAELTLFDDDPRQANMMNNDRPSILLQFYYSTGHLTVTLNYMCFRHELVWKKLFTNAREWSHFNQIDCGREFVECALDKMHEHENKVLTHLL